MEKIVVIKDGVFSGRIHETFRKKNKLLEYVDKILNLQVPMLYPAAEGDLVHRGFF